MDVVAKLDLMEQGTRYEHYMELRDAFDEGILMLQNSLRIDDNQKTSKRIENLKVAVALIESRINYLADADAQLRSYGKLAQTIRAIPPHRPAELPEVRESTRKECEEEMRKAQESGYAENDSPKSTEADKGTATKDPE